jgi:hypothetical protein
VYCARLDPIKHFVALGEAWVIVVEGAPHMGLDQVFNICRYSETKAMRSRVVRTH